jgi:hypothetical protein
MKIHPLGADLLEAHRQTNKKTESHSLGTRLSVFSKKHMVFPNIRTDKCEQYTRVGTLIVATIYLQLI